MKRVLYFVVLAIVLYSCTTGYPLKSVTYDDLFTDGTSKVWVINKQFVDDVDVAQFDLNSKEVLIFHDNGKVDYISLKAMGYKRPQKAKFYLDSELKEMTIEFNDKNWHFKLTKLEENRIIMKRMKGSDAKFNLELIPLPEL